MAQNEKFKNLSINGVNIPNTLDCVWCGGLMERKGETYMGSGTNSFTMWCNNCGAIAHFARNFSREITGFNIQYEFDKETGGE